MRFWSFQTNKVKLPKEVKATAKKFFFIKERNMLNSPFFLLREGHPAKFGCHGNIEFRDQSNRKRSKFLGDFDKACLIKSHYNEYLLLSAKTLSI